jgi:uncharacterized protein (DUF1499 family)
MPQLSDSSPEPFGRASDAAEFGAAGPSSRANRSRPSDLTASASAVKNFFAGILATGARLGLILTTLACAGAVTDQADLASGAVSACPSSPNCVSSKDESGGHFVAPLRFHGDPQAAWAAVERIVTGMPRTRIVESGTEFLHAESRSSVFGFVDDLELWLRASGKRIDVRSASRVGWSDMGVNRRRVETLRQGLIAAGLAN